MLKEGDGPIEREGPRENKRKIAVASSSDKQNKLKNNCSCCSFINVVPQKPTPSANHPKKNTYPICTHIVYGI